MDSHPSFDLHHGPLRVREHLELGSTQEDAYVGLAWHEVRNHKLATDQGVQVWALRGPT